jgi:hypothetical protein
MNMALGLRPVTRSLLKTFMTAREHRTEAGLDASDSPELREAIRDGRTRTRRRDATAATAD